MKVNEITLDGLNTFSNKHGCVLVLRIFGVIFNRFSFDNVTFVRMRIGVNTYT